MVRGPSGNASGVNDAAAVVALASADYADSHGMAALGRLVTYGHAGVEPRILQIGPVPAVRKVLDRSGLKVDEIDVFEVNEELAELNVIIEIPKGQRNKYEMEHQTGRIRLD